MIKNIAFSGGGIYGITYCGIVKALEEHNILNSLEVFIGTSAGSIIATLLVLGYNSQEIHDLIYGIDFNNIRDITTENILSFLVNYGVDSGNKILSILKIIIKGKTNNPDITFSELYQQTNKKLIITGTNLTSKKTEYFDYIKTPNMEVSLAIRISISIPILFSPITYKEQLYIDGCILDNFPIHKLPNDNTTIGISLQNTRGNNIDNIEDYIFSIISSLTNEFEYLRTHDYNNHIIYIKIPCHITPLEFDINNENKELLVLEGYNQTIDYLNTIQINDTTNTNNLIDDNTTNTNNLINTKINNTNEIEDNYIFINDINIPNKDDIVINIDSS